MKLIATLLLVLLAIGYGAPALFRSRDSRDKIRPRVARDDDKARWIEQVLDHFDITNTRTWKQRYFVNDDYYEEGGPMFLMVSGEQMADPSWLLEKTSLEGYLAKKFGARLMFLEHRYYGESRPTANLSAENLAYLSTYQSLADTVYFINHMNAKHSIPPSSKWILFGASYAGSLVTWMRYKYPHLVHAAVANSAPLQAQVDFQEYYLVIERALRKHSAKCVETLDRAFNDLYKQLKYPANYQELEKQFKTCSHFTAKVSSYDAATFFEVILEVPYKSVFDNAGGEYPSVETTCRILEDESLGKPLDRLARVNELILLGMEASCLSTEKYDKTVGDLLSESWEKKGIYDRPWIYQTCTEFGWYQTTTGRPFNISADAVPIKMYRQLCADVFGSNYREILDRGVERTNLIYGAKEIVNETSYTVFIHGSNDPWHAAGVYESSDPLVPVIFIEGGEHVPLIYPPNEKDSPNLAQAKRDLIELLDEWLNKA